MITLQKPFGLLMTAATVILLSAGCDQETSTELVVPPAQSNACTEHAACGADHLCANGVCTPGTCWPDYTREQCSDNSEELGPYCCKAWQICGDLFECVPDPDSPIGAQCEEDNECPNPGEFCSAGACYHPSGRAACTTTAQCGADERCDLEAFLCVPDRGGCTFCEDYPEVCCEDGWVCDPATTRCVEQGSEECTEATEATDCRAGQRCHQGRCVQCVTDDDCGPGTECSEATGSCYSVLNSCETDDDCRDGLRCSPVSSECVMPECENDAECRSSYDERYTCDENTFSCQLPPPECDTETDEPNGSTSNANPLANGAYSALLCRGDTDILSFPVAPEKRYSVELTVQGSSSSGIELTILDAAGLGLDSDTVSWDGNALVAGSYYGTENGTWYVRVAANVTGEDQWNYTVTMTETDAPPPVECVDSDTTDDVDYSDARFEPNDNFADAYEINLNPDESVIYSFAACHQTTATTCWWSDDCSATEECLGDVCGTRDFDWYKVNMPTQNSLDVTMEFEHDEGNLSLYLCTSEDCIEYSDDDGQIDESTNYNDVERVSAGDAYETLWVAVDLGSVYYPEPMPEQAYTLTFTTQGRPESCDADVGEPDDDTTAGAQTLAVDQTIGAVRCREDVDHYAVTIPANHTGTVSLNFNHSSSGSADSYGNLQLERIGDDGEVVDDSDSSSYNNSSETLEITPASTEQIVLVRVSLSSTYSMSEAQDYTIAVTSYDSEVCVDSEPDPNNDQSTATYIRPSADFTGDLQACDYAGGNNNCHMCGHNDDDWYHLGKLYADQEVSATLTHVAADGVLGFELKSANTPQATAYYRTGDDNDDAENVISLSYTENANTLSGDEREYYIRVYAEGDTGHQAQTYQLQVNFSEACFPDSYEEDGANNSQATATIGRDGTTGNVTAGNISANLCSGDVDVFEYFLVQNETITVTPESGDITVSLGDVNGDLATTEDADGGVASSSLTYTHEAFQQTTVWVRVGKAADAESNDYALTVTIE